MRFPPAIPSLLAVTLCVACTPGPPADVRTPYEVLPGKWGWEGSSDCQAAPLEISFSNDRKTMRLSHAPADDAGTRGPRKETVYSVLGDTPRGIHMAMQGEERLDAAGKPVTWELVVLHDAGYCWHRSDWPENACTKPVVRCAT